MPTPHTVQQGECLASIASAVGLYWKSVWEAPENETLRTKRSSPHVLFPGDVVYLPDKEIKEESGGTEKRHRFRKKGTPVWLRLRMLDDDRPRANEEYLLKVESLEFTGQTDADGRIEHRIPPEAGEAFLRLDGRAGGEDYILKIGALDPVLEISGVQARLHNLGFDPGPIDGMMGPQTKKALRGFQEKHKLETTGDAADKTKRKLEEVYGS